MHDYNFLNLSPPEFENLSRDLLQKELNVYIESFSEGPDGGIDLRFAKTKKGNSIIQCKRYKDYNSLLANLRKEVAKVKILKPKKYIITTSVGLNPNRKKEIQKLFNPFIKSTKDIYGKDDLNNLVGKYQDIEINHYKLWLSSTNILNKVIHNKIYNQGQFEKEQMNEIVRLYVQNDSFPESLKILNKYNFVIISGAPGIGKTTLANILTIHLLSKGYEEFIFLNNTINEGYSLFQEGKKQIFLFDDFLGKNFLDNKHLQNEENNIIRFIKKIRKSKDKALIFTTREYILNQAQMKFESFDAKIFDKTKCIVDLSKYTTLVKAKILFNHLFFSELPDLYHKEILKKNFYKKIISHRNYNPRIIEAILKKEIWEELSPKEFRKLFKNSFDNPQQIWKHAYENHIGVLSQCILSLLLSTGTPILYEDLLSVTQNYLDKLNTKYRISCSELDFRKSLRELENTFTISQSDSKGKIAILYQNPSIQDFLVNYLRDKKDIILDILENALFINQFYRIFGFQEELIIQNKKIKRTNNIFLKGELIHVYIKLVTKSVLTLKSSSLQKSTFSWKQETFYWGKPNLSIIQKLTYIKNDIFLDDYPEFNEFIKNTFTKYTESDAFILESDEIDIFINLLRIYKSDIKLVPKILFEKIIKNFSWYQDLVSFEELELLYPKEYPEFIEKNPSFKSILETILDLEFQSAEDNNLEEVLENLENLENKYSVNVDFEVESIKESLEDRETTLSSSDNSIQPILSEEIKEPNKKEEKNLIEDMFLNLLVNQIP